MNKSIELKKLPYKNPDVGIVLFEISDIVTASGGGGGDDSDDNTQQSTGGGYHDGSWS